MADALMAALQSKLAAFESAGMVDHVKRVKARIAELEKGVKKAPGPLPMTLSPTLVPAPALMKAEPVKKASKKAPTARKASKK